MKLFIKIKPPMMAATFRSAMSVIATYKTLRDLRRDRRYPLPTLQVTLLGARYETANWSMGGLLLTGFRAMIAAGTAVRGTLRVQPDGPDLPFDGRVARSVGSSGELAICFNTRDPEIISELDRGMSRRLRRGPGECR